MVLSYLCYYHKSYKFFPSFLLFSFILTAQKNEVFHYGFLRKMWPNPQESAGLVTFTEEIRNGKLHFFGAVPWPSSDKLLVVSKGFLKLLNLFMLIKQKFIFFQKLGSGGFRQLDNSVLNKFKFSIHSFLDGLEVLSFASSKAKLFIKILWEL